MAGFDETLERYHGALEAFYNGSPDALKELVSRHPDVVLAGAYGDMARGWARVSNTLDYAVSHFGGVRGLRFESIVRRVADDVAYVVEIERFDSRLRGASEWTAIALRVTTIFAREEGAWRVIERHGDQLVSRIDTATYRAILRAQEPG